MSLINKVLRDLETQRADAAEARARRSPLVQDELRPVRPVKSQFSRRPLALAGLAVALIAAAAIAWNQWGVNWLAGRKPVPAAEPPKAIATVPTVPDKVAATAPKADAPPSPGNAAEPRKPPPEPPKTAAAPVPKTEAPAPAKPAEAPRMQALGAPAPNAGDAEAPTPAPAGKPPAADLVVRKTRTEAPSAPATEKTTVAKAAPPPMEAPVGGEPEPEQVPEAKPKSAKPVLEKKVKPLTPEQRAESEYRKAAASLQQKRTGEGEAHLRAALQAQPSHVKARELLAGLALQGGRWREAQSLLEQGLQLNPAHYPFAQLLARSYVDHGQEKKALELLEQSHAAAGGDPDYLGFLAALQQRAGRHDAATRNFSEALKLRPQEGRWWLGLAISLEAAEKWKESAEAYRRAAASGSLDKQLLQYSQQRLAVVKNK